MLVKILHAKSRPEMFYNLKFSKFRKESNSVPSWTVTHMYDPEGMCKVSSKLLKVLVDIDACKTSTRNSIKIHARLIGIR